MKAFHLCVVFISCVLLPGTIQAASGVLRVIEVDHEERVVDGVLERESNGEKIPIKNGQATIRNWTPGEKLRVYPANTERYASPHFDTCPLPQSNLIHVRTRAGNRRVMENATYLAAHNNLLGAYANYLLAGRLKPTQDTAAIVAARRTSIDLLARELGVSNPIQGVDGTTVKVTPAFTEALRAFQRRLGVPDTGVVDYQTLKAANKDIPASVLVKESATSGEFKRMIEG
jgi:hypothetical protein